MNVMLERGLGRGDGGRGRYGRPRAEVCPVNRVARVGAASGNPKYVRSIGTRGWIWRADGVGA